MAARQIVVHARQHEAPERVLESGLPIARLARNGGAQALHLGVRQLEAAASRLAVRDVVEVVVVQRQAGEIFQPRRRREPATGEHVLTLPQLRDVMEPGDEPGAVGVESHGGEHGDFLAVSRQNAHDERTRLERLDILGVERHLLPEEPQRAGADPAGSRRGRPRQHERDAQGEQECFDGTRLIRPRDSRP